jgi:hypothetical protein
VCVCERERLKEKKGADKNKNKIDNGQWGEYQEKCLTSLQVIKKKIDRECRERAESIRIRKQTMFHSII